MIVIGLTGGSGAGKGAVCQKFRNLNIDSIDTDLTSRQVCAKGKPCLNELVSIFGDGILLEDGSLDRRGLAAIVFADKAKLAILNKITHRYILNEVRVWLEGQRAAGRKAAIVDAPLLYESGFDKECDVIISVIADRSVRLRRIIARDGITEEAAEARLNKQGDDAFYTERADYIITNNGSTNLLDSQIDCIYKQIIGRTPE